MDLRQYAGIAGIPLVRILVEQIKSAFPEKLKGLLSVLSSLIIGVGLNLVLALIAGEDWTKAILVGILTGFGANIYYDQIK